MSNQSNSMLRVGVIGCGGVASNHIPVIQDNPNAKLVSISDVDSETLRNTSRKYSIHNTYENPDEMLEKTNLDAVHILTPPHFHKDLTVKAAKQGIHIMVEKPMCMNSKEAEEMVEVAEENDVKLCVAHCLLFTSIMKEAFKRKENIGEIVGLNGYFVAPKLEIWADWILDLRGGHIEEALPHQLYLMTKFMDEVDSVYADARKKFEKPKDHPIDELHVQLAGEKITGSFSVLKFGPRPFYMILVTGKDKTLAVDLYNRILFEWRGGDRSASSLLGANLSIAGQIIGKNIVEGVRFGKRKLTGEKPFTYSGHGELIDSFIDSILNSEDPPVKGEEGAKIVKLSERIFDSVEEGKKLNV